MTGEKMEIPEILQHLSGQDPAFQYLPEAIREQLAVLLERGGQRNRGFVTVKDYIFSGGDRDGLFMPRMKLLRAEAIICGRGVVPDEEIKDSLVDCINYLLMWLCCRAERADAPKG